MEYRHMRTSASRLQSSRGAQGSILEDLFEIPVVTVTDSGGNVQSLRQFSKAVFYGMNCSNPGAVISRFALCHIQVASQLCSDPSLGT